MSQAKHIQQLLEQAMTLGADYLSTGHYARVKHTEGRAELRRAVDPGKDQSYVLYTLGQAELGRTLFPVGEYPKAEIREIARRHRLPNAEKPDSADICFIPSGDYRSFVRSRVETAPGDIIGSDGEWIGRHEGIVDYTVGQRKRVPARGGDEPLFVLNVDAQTNTVVGLVEVGQRPWGITMSPDGRTLYTANGPSNDVSIVDVATRSVTARVKAGDSPWGAVFVP